ncbi:hypothetical protein BGZ61DRAFT_510737 [Ilyonectria robusta]|uniref:uncharacterized protein n=1 Tax=Ilyonectria robusta TaxID=1079257 RepID=UPI001E8D33D4|nr:uncharacterized protein BGZ61DRAFT_510737 [Ilyonectria robusta]KAH8656779.1 hypothetical protein BGZ61DRAFT_510737 [Ilyonectria robusta]
MQSRSDQACSACNKRKRRCDKGLPACSLCRRIGRLCEYGIVADPPPTANEWSMSPAPAPVLASTSGSTVCDAIDSHSPEPSSVASSSRSVGITPVNSRIKDPGLQSGAYFPASIFLDVDCYVWSRIQLPPPRGAIPAPVLVLLSQGNIVLDLPIVFKKRIDIGLPVQNTGPDLAMLFIGMKLVTTHANNITAAGLYLTAKNFLTRLESNSTILLLCLQALVLIALYKYSYTIYPAAWITIGSYTYYAEILGLTPGNYSILGQASIYILNRLMSTGSRRHYLIPDLQTDSSQDCSNIAKALSRLTSTLYQVKQSGFTRLYQASIYLGQAISCTQETLSYKLTSFGAALNSASTALKPEDRYALLAPQYITRSALFVALNRFTYPEKIAAEPGYLNSPKQSIHIIQLASEQLYTLGIDILRIIKDNTDIAQPYSLGRVSPFIIDSAYAGAATAYRDILIVYNVSVRVEASMVF